MTITIEDFQKVDIRVGNIVGVEDFPKARKPSYKLRVDFGPLGVKTSGATLAAFYSKEDLMGRQVVAVVNFPPRQIANVMSEVLLLGAMEEDGRILLLHPDGPATPGARIA